MRNPTSIIRPEWIQRIMFLQRWSSKEWCKDDSRPIWTLLPVISTPLLPDLTLMLRVPRPAPGPPVIPLVPSAPPLLVQEPRLPPLERYTGESGGCCLFLTQCQLIMQLQLSTLLTKRFMVAYVITQLTGRAKNWVIAIWETDHSCCRNF